MALKDEEEEIIPRVEERLTRADAKKEALRRQVEKERGKKLESGKVGLKSGLDLKQLRKKMAGKEDEEQKRRERTEREEEDRKKGFKTETLKEREEREVTTAQKKMGPEDLIEEEKKKEEMEEQAGEEFQPKSVG